MALEVPYRSIPDMFYKRVAATPNGQAFAVANADDTGMVWHTWAQVGERATAIAAGLRELGIGLEDRVAILSGTRFEWVLADLGINCAGAATTTVYPTTEPEDASYIVADSGSKVLIAENAKQALKISGVDTAVTHVVLIDGPADAGATPPQLTLAELEERGAAVLRSRSAGRAASATAPAPAAARVRSSKRRTSAVVRSVGRAARLGWTESIPPSASTRA